MSIVHRLESRRSILLLRIFFHLVISKCLKIFLGRDLVCFLFWPCLRKFCRKNRPVLLHSCLKFTWNHLFSRLYWHIHRPNLEVLVYLYCCNSALFKAFDFLQIPRTCWAGRGHSSSNFHVWLTAITSILFMYGRRYERSRALLPRFSG